MLALVKDGELQVGRRERSECQQAGSRKRQLNSLRLTSEEEDGKDNTGREANTGLDDCIADAKISLLRDDVFARHLCGGCGSLL